MDETVLQDNDLLKGYFTPQNDILVLPRFIKFLFRIRYPKLANTTRTLYDKTELLQVTSRSPHINPIENILNLS